jgi:hypothetical protein
MPKPFSLQSPEDIAKEYGGNKQKIAQAMQMGVVDPTAGTLAGMFIDRMRGAQMQEAAQQPSVAQQVFAPPAPPMGASPMGGMPPAPPMGAPPMGGMPPAPPMGGAMPPAPPMGAPPMGMADGGLAALPVPDMMFDEPMDGGYAGGGIVAFDGGGPVGVPDDEEIEVIGQREPDQLYGFFRDPRRGMEQFQQLYKPERKAADRSNQFFENILSPEGQKERRDESKWFALAQLGATMASTPGSLLQAASAGVKSALPGLKDASKELRAETRDAVKQLLVDEGMRNKDALDAAKAGIEGQGKYAELSDAVAKRIADRGIAELNAATDLKRTQMQVAGTLGAARIGADAARESNPIKLVSDIVSKASAEAQDAVDKWRTSQPAYTPNQAAAVNEQAEKRFGLEYQKRIAAYAQANPMLANLLGVSGSGMSAGYGAPPPGAVKPIG